MRHTVKYRQKIPSESEGEAVKETTLYHAGKSIVEFPEVRKTKYTKDFSWGFYCTKDYKQAKRWAKRGEGTPIVNKYKFELILENSFGYWQNSNIQHIRLVSIQLKR